MLKCTNFKSRKAEKLESFQKVADEEGMNVSDVVFICKLTNDNKKRWKYIRLFKEGNSLEKIKKYDEENSLMEAMQILSSLNKFNNSFSSMFY